MRDPQYPMDGYPRQPEYEEYNPRHGVGKALTAVGIVITASLVGAWYLIEHPRWKDTHSAAHPDFSPTPEFTNPVPITSEAPTSSLPVSSTEVTFASPTSVTPSSPEPSSSSFVVSPGSEEFKIAQDMIVGFDASKTSFDTIKQVVEDTHIGGVFLVQTQDGNDLYREISQLPDIRVVASDEEGGLVQRITYPFNFPSAQQMGTMSDAQVERIGKRAGQQMRAAGITMDLAPVLDIDNGLHNGAISALERSFSSNTDTIAAKASAFARGLEAAGITPVFKHFPGIGRAMPDSNTDVHIAVSPPLSSLERHDLLPYTAMFYRGLGRAVMLSNEYVPGLDANNPASVSPAAVQLLHDMDFNGVITTDDLRAPSVLPGHPGYDGRNLVQNITQAVEAGVDAPLFTFTSEQAIFRAIQEIKAHVPAAQIDNSFAKIAALKGNA